MKKNFEQWFKASEEGINRHLQEQFDLLNKNISIVGTYMAFNNKALRDPARERPFEDISELELYFQDKLLEVSKTELDLNALIKKRDGLEDRESVRSCYIADIGRILSQLRRVNKGFTDRFKILGIFHDDGTRKHILLKLTARLQNLKAKLGGEAEGNAVFRMARITVEVLVSQDDAIKALYPLTSKFEVLSSAYKAWSENVAEVDYLLDFVTKEAGARNVRA